MNSDYRHILQAIGSLERTTFDHLKDLTGFKHNPLRARLRDLQRWKWVEKIAGEYEMTEKGVAGYESRIVV